MRQLTRHSADAIEITIDLPFLPSTNATLLLRLELPAGPKQYFASNDNNLRVADHRFMAA